MRFAPFVVVVAALYRGGIVDTPFGSPASSCSADCENYVPFGTVTFWHTIPNVGNTRFDFRSPHTMTQLLTSQTAYYTNGTGLSDPTTAPDNKVWIAEGQYKCTCLCVGGLPRLTGLGPHPSQFTVQIIGHDPEEDEANRDDFAGGCLEPPCPGGGTGGGGSPGGGSTGYLGTFDYPTQGSSPDPALELHTVCQVTDWYVNGHYTHTTIDSCWEELHESHP